MLSYYKLNLNTGTLHILSNFIFPSMEKTIFWKSACKFVWRWFKFLEKCFKNNLLIQRRSAIFNLLFDWGWSAIIFTAVDASLMIRYLAIWIRKYEHNTKIGILLIAIIRSMCEPSVPKYFNAGDGCRMHVLQKCCLKQLPIPFVKCLSEKRKLNLFLIHIQSSHYFNLKADLGHQIVI